MFRSGRRLKEHQPDDQRKQEPENKAPQDGERPTEVAIGGVRVASRRLIHWPSIAYLAVGLAQLAWIYTTVRMRPGRALSITADTYTHVLADENELDYKEVFS